MITCPYAPGGGLSIFSGLDRADQDAANVVQQVDQQDQRNQSAITNQGEPGQPGEQQLLKPPLGKDGNHVLSTLNLKVNARNRVRPTILAKHMHQAAKGNHEAEEEVKRRDPAVASVGMRV